MACLVAAYKAMNGAGRKSKTELTLMIRPLPWLSHMRQHGAGHPDRAEDVGLKQRAGLLDRALLRCAGHSDARVVDHDVDTPGSLEHPAHHTGHRLIVGDVERQEHH